MCTIIVEIKVQPLDIMLFFIIPGLVWCEIIRTLVMIKKKKQQQFIKNEERVLRRKQGNLESYGTEIETM